ncbi:MAG: hypothetical protein QOJ68_2774, partial [Blastococcus sp.]|nr:hypothetical protein [Blastococcus sp.]
GFGVTSCRALRSALESRGHRVSTIAPSMATPSRRSRIETLLRTYTTICDRTADEQPDAVVLFHILHTLPAELRRAMADLQLGTRLIGYSHGSHWDPTDRYREEVYPGFALADLANLACLDDILLVSEYMKESLVEHISELNPALARRLEERMHVVGLPIDTTALDHAMASRDDNTLDVLFNHALIPAKRPDVFVAAARIVLDRYDFVTVTMTRRAPNPGPIEHSVQRLQADYGSRVRLGNDLDVETYFRLLWRTAVQVSTAEHESLGLGTLEAMYAGVCCVLPDRCCYPEIVGPVREALYEPGLDGLVAALVQAIDKTEFRSAVGGRLQEQARRYAPEVVAARVSNVLDNPRAGSWFLRRADWRESGCEPR